MSFFTSSFLSDQFHRLPPGWKSLLCQNKANFSLKGGMDFKRLDLNGYRKYGIHMERRGNSVFWSEINMNYLKNWAKFLKATLSPLGHSRPRQKIQTVQQPSEHMFHMQTSCIFFSASFPCFNPSATWSWIWANSTSWTC